MQTTDAEWGVKWVEEVNETFAQQLLVAIALHVAGEIHGRRRPLNQNIRTKQGTLQTAASLSVVPTCNEWLQARR